MRGAVPRKLRTLWSDILTDIALSMADGKMESVVRRTLRRYLMLKAVLVKSLRGGGGCRNRNVNLAEKLMTAFYKGDEDEVWHTAQEIERSRQKKRELQEKRRRKRNIKGKIIEGSRQKDDTKRRSDRAKMLTNDGELSKAFATMVQ